MLFIKKDFLLFFIKDIDEMWLAWILIFSPYQTAKDIFIPQLLWSDHLGNKTQQNQTFP